MDYKEIEEVLNALKKDREEFLNRTIVDQNKFNRVVKQFMKDLLDLGYREDEIPRVLRLIEGKVNQELSKNG